MRFLTALLVGGLLPSALTAIAAEPERLEYRWRLEGPSALFGKLLFPTSGNGWLVRERLDNGNLKSELLITAGGSRGTDYFRYAAEYDPATLAAVRAWSVSHWQGKERSKSVEVKEVGVIDLVSGIEWIRRHRPTTPVELKIWSDGKLYPVRIRQVPSSSRRQAGVDTYFVEGVERPGERFWAGQLELKLIRDPAATPMEIVVRRSLGRVRLILAPSDREV